jgi:hypothetical protein
LVSSTAERLAPPHGSSTFGTGRHGTTSLIRALGNGTETNSERAIRWLILMMVLCCDPLAIALTAAAAARR